MSRHHYFPFLTQRTGFGNVDNGSLNEIYC